MKIILLFCFSLSCFFSYSGEREVPVSKGADSVIKQIFSEYGQALTAHDMEFLKKWFISSEEYAQLLEFVKQKQPNCIGNDEASFTTETNNRVYSDLLTSKIVIKQISVKQIDYNFSCGNLLEIPRVVCTVVYSGNKVVEIPFLLVKTMNGQYKILRNFLNYKLFGNE
ncbi:MAG: hypothetical protein JWN78_1228 [Bacteroidota bacterium]|nr:hypothetical protein [Bacteroidota bacterium]